MELELLNQYIDYLNKLNEVISIVKTREESPVFVTVGEVTTTLPNCFSDGFLAMLEKEKALVMSELRAEPRGCFGTRGPKHPRTIEEDAAFEGAFKRVADTIPSLQPPDFDISLALALIEEHEELGKKIILG